jgi:LysR family transcriptional regulator, flagellar master operon regulator
VRYKAPERTASRAAASTSIGGLNSSPIIVWRFRTFAGAALTVNVGWIGLERILAVGGSGYFTTRLVRKHEVTGRLHRVTRAPEFRLPVYLVYATKSDSEVLTLALDTVRRIVAETQ